MGATGERGARVRSIISPFIIIYYTGEVKRGSGEREESGSEKENGTRNKTTSYVIWQGGGGGCRGIPIGGSGLPVWGGGEVGSGEWECRAEKRGEVFDYLPLLPHRVGWC